MSLGAGQTLKRVEARDAQGRTLIFHYAACGDDEHVERLLNANWDAAPVDCTGVTPLHLAAAAGHSMVAYLLASKAYAACRVLDSGGQSPADTAAAAKKGEVLNAMLLACAGGASREAVASLVHVIGLGAVPDTWAPDGSSALMLAAAVDNAEGVDALLDAGASVELADALGRTALMFAAGRGAPCALIALLRAGASVATRDRRGRNVMAYAAEESQTHKLLDSHMEVLEKRASALQADLLAAEASELRAASPSLGAKAKGKKKGKRAKAAAVAADAISNGGASLLTAAACAREQGSHSIHSPISEDGAQTDSDAEASSAQEAQHVTALDSRPRPSASSEGSIPAVSGVLHGGVRDTAVLKVANCSDSLKVEDCRHRGADSAGWVQVAKGGSRRSSAVSAAAVSPRPASAGADSTPRKRSISVASISSCDTDSSAGSAWTHLGGWHRGKALMQPQVASKLAPAPASAPRVRVAQPQSPRSAQDTISPLEIVPAVTWGLPVMHDASAGRQVPGRPATAFGPPTLQEQHQVQQQQQQQQQQPVVGTWASKVAGRSVSCGDHIPAPDATLSGIVTLVCSPLQELPLQPAPSGALPPHPTVPSPAGETSPAVQTASQPPSSNSSRYASASDAKQVAMTADRALAEAHSELVSHAAEIAVLRADVAALLMVQLRHQGEIELILRDAAAHEAHAVSSAVAAERAACAQVFGAYMRCPSAVAATLADAVRCSVSDSLTSAVISSEHTHPLQLTKVDPGNGGWEGGAHHTIWNHSRERSSALDTMDALQRLQLDGKADTDFTGQEGIQLNSSYGAVAEPPSAGDPGPHAINGGVLHEDPFAAHSLPEQPDAVAVPHQYLHAAQGTGPAGPAGLGCGIFGASAVWGMRSSYVSGQL